MRIKILNWRGQRTILDVPNYITVRELNDRYTRTIGVGGYRFQYEFGGDLLQYDRQLCHYDIEDDDCIETNEIIARGGGEHTCPYGCGRKIPDNYKGWQNY